MSLGRHAWLAVAVALTAVTGAGPDVSPPLVSQPYAIAPLAPQEGPYADDLVGRLVSARSDSTGVVQFPLEHGGATDHPVQLAQEVLRLLGDHAVGAGDRYLEQARRHADRLLLIGDDVDGALFFRYTFEFALHGNEHDLMKPPWYSGMAQGQALSAFVALFEATGDPAYRQAADATFASFLDRGMPAAELPWVTFVDDEGYLWLEEYAKDPPMRVLNGHLFAVFGLYDYIRLTDDPAAGSIFDAAVTTVRRYGEEFRNPGGLSSYCLRVQKTSEKYHFVHINQLRTLSTMTGDPWFAGLADRLAADYSLEPIARSPAVLRWVPGRTPAPRR